MTNHNSHIHSKKHDGMDEISKFKIRSLNSIERRKICGKILKRVLIVVAALMVLAAIAITILD